MFIIIYTLFTGTIASMFHQRQFLNLVYNEYFERNILKVFIIVTIQLKLYWSCSSNTKEGT